MTSFPVQGGMALNTLDSTPRFYQNYPRGNYYHNFVSTSDHNRTQGQGYQNKRRYPLGNFTVIVIFLH